MTPRGQKEQQQSQISKFADDLTFLQIYIIVMSSIIMFWSV